MASSRRTGVVTKTMKNEAAIASVIGIPPSSRTPLDRLSGE